MLWCLGTANLGTLLTHQLVLDATNGKRECFLCFLQTVKAAVEILFGINSKASILLGYTAFNSSHSAQSTQSRTATALPPAEKLQFLSSVFS